MCKFATKYINHPDYNPCEGGRGWSRSTTSKFWTFRTTFNAYNLLHREDGPAVEWDDGSVRYCLFNMTYSKEEYWNHPLVLEHKLKQILETEP